MVDIRSNLKPEAYQVVRQVGRWSNVLTAMCLLYLMMLLLLLLTRTLKNALVMAKLNYFKSFYETFHHRRSFCRFFFPPGPVRGKFIRIRRC